MSIYIKILFNDRKMIFDRVDIRWGWRLYYHSFTLYVVIAYAYLVWPWQNGKERCHAWTLEPLEWKMVCHLCKDPRILGDCSRRLWSFLLLLAPWLGQQVCPSWYQHTTWLIRPFVDVVKFGDGHICPILSSVHACQDLVSEQNTIHVQRHVFLSPLKPLIPVRWH